MHNRCFLKLKAAAAICIIAASVFSLTACGSTDSGSGSSSSGTSSGTSSGDSSSSSSLGGDSGDQSDSGGTYTAPEFAEADFHEEHASESNGISVDLEDTAEGYISAEATSDSRLKLQVLYEDQTYTYDLPSDGTPIVCPLQCGNGEYTVRVMSNVTDNRYAEVYSAEVNVVLDDEFEPFIRPNVMSDYSEDSACVQLASELSEGATSEMDVVNAIYDYIRENITYDYDAAAAVTDGYLPDVDAVLADGKGICFDYASLAAAMLRSQGIPTKVVFGYVSPGNIYHAWNMFYTEGTGWVTVSYDAVGSEWNRIDLTFSANGSDGMIGDGADYTDVFYY